MTTSMKSRMRVGEKGQIVIPKEVRQKAGIKEGTQVTVEFREGEVVVKRAGPPAESFVDYFTSTYSKKLTKELDVKKTIEEEYLGSIQRIR